MSHLEDTGSVGEKEILCFLLCIQLFPHIAMENREAQRMWQLTILWESRTLMLLASNSFFVAHYTATHHQSRLPARAVQLFDQNTLSTILCSLLTKGCMPFLTNVLICAASMITCIACSPALGCSQNQCTWPCGYKTWSQSCTMKLLTCK